VGTGEVENGAIHRFGSGPRPRADHLARMHAGTLDPGPNHSIPPAHSRRAAPARAPVTRTPRYARDHEKRAASVTERRRRPSRRCRCRARTGGGARAARGGRGHCRGAAPCRDAPLRGGARRGAGGGEPAIGIGAGTCRPTCQRRPPRRTARSGDGVRRPGAPELGIVALMQTAGPGARPTPSSASSRRSFRATLRQRARQTHPAGEPGLEQRAYRRSAGAAC
jgi:hypothetical protein